LNNGGFCSHRRDEGTMMKAKPLAHKAPTERIVNDIRRATRKHYSAE
jgi:hypothetical protein